MRYYISPDLRYCNPCLSPETTHHNSIALTLHPRARDVVLPAVTLLTQVTLPPTTEQGNLALCICCGTISTPLQPNHATHRRSQNLDEVLVTLLSVDNQMRYKPRVQPVCFFLGTFGGRDGRN